MSKKTPRPIIAKRPVSKPYGVGMTYQYRWDAQMHAWASWVHTMLGTLWGTDTFFRLLSTEACTDYGIGGLLDGDYDGVIFEWIDATARKFDTPWASGWSNAPDFDDQGKEFYAKFGSKGVNALGRAIELSGQLTTVVTTKQWAAPMHLLAYLHHTELNQGFEEFAWNMHHREVAEKDCPFPRVYKFTKEYQTGVKLIMEHYEIGKDIPDTIKINGMDVPLMGGQDPVVILPPEKPIFVPFPKVQKFTARKGSASHQWAYMDSKIVRRYEPGTVLRSQGYYHAEEYKGEDRWLVITSPGVSNNARMNAAQVREAIPDFEGLSLVS